MSQKPGKRPLHVVAATWVLMSPTAGAVLFGISALTVGMAAIAGASDDAVMLTLGGFYALNGVYWAAASVVAIQHQIAEHAAFEADRLMMLLGRRGIATIGFIAWPVLMVMDSVLRDDGDDEPNVTPTA